MRLASVGQHGAKKSDGVAALDQQGRKVFDIEVADDIGLVLDINPDEVLVRMALGQRFEGGAVLAAYIAPCRASCFGTPRNTVVGQRQCLERTRTRQ